MKNIFLLICIVALCWSCEDVKNSTATVKTVPIAEFTKGLNAITVNDFTAIEQGTALFDSLRKELPNPGISDTLFYPHYWNFYQKKGQQIVAQMTGGDTSKIAEVEQIANEYGFDVNATASSIQAIPGNRQYLKTKVIPYLSDPFAKYVQQVINQNSQSNPNAAQIGMSVLFWESFAKNNPNHPLAADAQARFKSSLPLLLVGTTQTPFFTETGLESTFPVVYNQIIMKEGDSQVTPILMKYLDVLKVNGFKRTEAVDAFLKQFM